MKKLFALMVLVVSLVAFVAPAFAAWSPNCNMGSLAQQGNGNKKRPTSQEMMKEHLSDIIQDERLDEIGWDQGQLGSSESGYSF